MKKTLFVIFVLLVVALFYFLPVKSFGNQDFGGQGIQNFGEEFLVKQGTSLNMTVADGFTAGDIFIHAGNGSTQGGILSLGYGGGTNTGELRFVNHLNEPLMKIKQVGTKSVITVSKPVCWVLPDSDGLGVTYMTVNNGRGYFSITPCNL